MEGGLLSLKWNNHRSSFIHVLSSLRKKDSFCDVTIACDGKFYPSHKLVLSTCSEYFQEMFQHTQCKHPIIVLKDIHSEDLESLLNYMYIGEVNVLQEKLSTLIKAAECLKIRGLAVPDDAGAEKRSSGSDIGPESKRRKTDSDHHRNKESSRSNSKSTSKYTEPVYRSTVNNTDGFTSPRLPSSTTENEDSNSQFNLSSESTSEKDKDNFDVSFIKSEPPDSYEPEDTKEGVLKRAHESFLNPLPQEEVSNSEPLSSSEPQDMWGSENRPTDDYPPLDGAGSAPGSEELPPDDSGWREKKAAKVWNENRPEFLQGQEKNSGSWKTEGSPKDLSTNREQPSWVPFSGNERTPRENFGFPKYQCSLCTKGFDHKGNYRKHVRTHTGERPFECPICQYSATQKGNLQAHIKRRHPDSNWSIFEGNE